MRLLQKALQVYREWEEAGKEEDPKSLLSRFPDLEEYLEPLLEEGAVEEGQGEASTGQLGDFEILRELGRGGMGVVYEARQISLGRKVALKVLSMGPASSQAGLVRFRREARIAAGLDHPGLVKILAFGNEGETYFLAMELVEGAPLDKVLSQVSKRERKDLDGKALGRIVASLCGGEFIDSQVWRGGYVECALDLVRQVAEALDYAHKAGIVHRDVKPSNILVRPDGRAVLTDFGLARERGNPTMTLTGDFVGTPFYVSPEQAKGGAVDGRSDVFSLGTVLYELLTLRKPFQGKSTHQVLGRILTKDPADPHRLDPDLHPDLSAVILQALEKDPDKRYATAGTLAADLRAFLEYRPVSARRPSLARKALKWVKREPWKASLAAALILGLPALGTMGFYLISKRGEIRRAEYMARKERAEDLLGRSFLVAEEDLTRAAGMVREAVALDPENREFKAFAGYFGLEAGKEGTPPEEDRPTSFWLFRKAMVLGKEAVEKIEPGKLKDAVGMLERAIVLSPRPRALYFFSLASLAHKAWTGKFSPQVCRKAARDAVHGLVNFWPDRVVSRFFQAVGLACYEPKMALALLKELERAGYERDHSFFWLKANCLSSLGRKEEALETYRVDLALNGGDPAVAAAVYNHMGYIFSERGDKKSAIRFYRKAVEKKPSFAQGWNNLGVVFFEEGEMEEAQKCLERALKEDPGYLPPILTLVDVLRRRRRAAKAVALLEKGLEAAPGNYSMRLNLAWFLRKSGKKKEAEDNYRRLVRIDPARGGGFNGLGLLRGKDPLEALYWFHRAVDVEPDNPKYRLNLGTALARLGRFKDALPHIREAALRNPKHRISHQNLVRIYKDLGRAMDARKEILRWLEKDPSSLWDWFTLAGLHSSGGLGVDEGGLEEWIRSAEKAVELTRRGDPEALLFLAQALEKKGKTDQAWKLLGEARKLLGSSPLSPSKKRRVEKLLRGFEGAWKAGGKHGPGTGGKDGPGGRVQQGAGVRRGQGPGR